MRHASSATARRTCSKPSAGTWNILILLAVLLQAVAPQAAGAGLADHLERECDFDANPWCRMPGNPADSYISRDEALAISRGDEAARKRLWGWGGPAETFGAWGSAATDGRRMYFFGGGHHHYRGNDIKVYDFETLSWSRLYDPAYVTEKTHPAGDRRYVPEVGPRATHVYDGMVYSRETNSLFLWGHYNFHGWQFDLDVWERTNDPWQAWSRFPMPQGTRDLPPDFFRAGILDNGDVLLHGSNYARGRGDMMIFDPKTRRYSGGVRMEFIVTALTGAGERAYGRDANAQRLNVYGQDGRRIDQIDMPDGFAGHGIAHHPARNLLVFWEGTADTLVYDLDAGEWRQVGTLAENVPAGARNGPYGRWRYLPAHDVFLGLAQTQDGGPAMWAYRLPDPLPETHPLKEVRREQGYSCSDEIAGWTCPDLQKQVDSGTVRTGVYHQCAAVRNAVDFNGSWLRKKVCERKASLITFDGAVVENVKITDITIGSNANCVRWQRGSLVIHNMTCRRADMGLLGFGERLVITNSTFEQTLDRGSNHGHLVYACPHEATGSELLIRDTTLRAPGDDGHVLKTGCATTRIENSVLDGADGNYSRVIDAFNGGRLTIRNSTIAAGESGGNGDLVGYGAEMRQTFPSNRVEVRGGVTDCRNLPIWGRALHRFAGKVQPEAVTWSPATNHGCRP